MKFTLHLVFLEDSQIYFGRFPLRFQTYIYIGLLCSSQIVTKIVKWPKLAKKNQKTHTHTKKTKTKKLTNKKTKNQTFERLPDVRFKLINIDFSSDRTV